MCYSSQAGRTQERKESTKRYQAEEQFSKLESDEKRKAIKETCVTKQPMTENWAD
ncbi:hypothetical protein DPMN_072722 [Dreissena polymorpha]|uniref:Uncharacterized protein n=1 Tax=Dreissena polymorpha TaxID=45954 RepID=A0A9D4BXU0_DREPO|nr:hypothetical protein DPMN_072722 [Dreissena polymorpha]